MSDYSMILWKLNKLLYKLSHRVSKISDILSGVDFEIIVDAKDSHGVHYEPTTFLTLIGLRKYFKQNMSIGEGISPSIIDIGCGKGKMLYFFSKFDFNRIRGLEYDRNTARVGRKNISLLKKRGRIKKGNVEIVIGDASTYSDYSDFNWFYLYNPFDEVVMERFLDNLIISQEQKKRDLTVIYMNPVHEQLLISKGFQLMTRFYYRTAVFRRTI